ncbi:hypothetical protein L3V18_10525 [Lysobacter sp. TLK-CK17T]|uniref:Uncharacterized protein n=2 Tax=Marilutibacter chinensis TaxID=2912247 RepID=A0ABS9HTJ2_9GAMM|nr:hypothetical protein [Lysobacter chinensis]
MEVFPNGKTCMAALRWPPKAPGQGSPPRCPPEDSDEDDEPWDEWTVDGLKLVAFYTSDFKGLDALTVMLPEEDRSARRARPEGGRVQPGGCPTEGSDA